MEFHDVFSISKAAYDYNFPSEAIYSPDLFWESSEDS